MDTQLDGINWQIQQEKDRHNRVINDLDKKRNQENTLHQQKIQQLNNQKEQIKRYAKLENCFYTHSNKRRATLGQMEETIKKAMEGLE